MDNRQFYLTLEREIANMQLSDEAGMPREQLFTRHCMELLCEAGETENFMPAYFEQYLGTPKQMKINGYARYDNDETIDLFISVYENRPEFYVTHKDEIERAATRVANFYRKAIYNELEKTIDESQDIFEFSHTLGTYEELRNNLIRINVFILTNGQYKGECPKIKEIGGYKLLFQIIDIDTLFRLSQNPHSPIVINFEEMGFKVPCLEIANNNSSTYKAYIAVITGDCLYRLYEDYGSRLLEQNVRSFLQFTGKINKGIRETILKEPEMFLAYNNGISATADKIELKDYESGVRIAEIHNLQIVNGGQTTASIYHTFRDAKRDNKPDMSKIAVQVKLSVIGVNEEYSAIVSNISKCSNTQNKVNDADFSSNNPILIKLEQLSRSILTPVSEINNIRSYWYFERVRGQYKTAKRRESILSSREKAFLSKYPEKQVFTKETLAKFVNAYSEVWEGKKLVIGPHNVVKGGQSNFTRFINNNLPKANKMDSIFYEDLIAKAILFMSVDRRYGTRRTGNAIGDLKNATVPYTISLLNIILEKHHQELNLYKIWKNQSISDSLSDFMYKLMVQVNSRIIEAVSPDTNYTERAKKEEIWMKVREFNLWKYDLDDIKDDLINPQKPPRRISSDVLNIATEEEERNYKAVMSLPWKLWEEIARWGEEYGTMTRPQQNAANEIAKAIKCKYKPASFYIKNGIAILDVVWKENYELLEKAEAFKSEGERVKQERAENEIEINLEIIKQMVAWDKKNKKLAPWKYKVMNDVVLGLAPLTDKKKYAFKYNLEELKKYGFEPII